MKIIRINALIISKIAAMLSLAMFVLHGCKKDKQTVTNPLTLLTAGKWKRTAYDGNPSSNPTGAYIYQSTPSCVLDDTFSYFKDGNYNFKGGSDKCDPSEQLQYTSKYTVDFQAKTITQFGFKLEILELTATRMKLTEAIPSASGEQLVYLFVH